MRTTTLVSLLLLSLAVPRVALAQAETREEKAKKRDAKQFYEAGRDSFDAGQYDKAIVSFEEAYRLSPRAPVVYALALAYRKQWILDHDAYKVRRAAKLFRDYLAMPDAEMRDKATDYLDETEAEVKKLDEADAAAGRKAAEALPPPPRTTLVVSTPAAKDGQVSLDGGPPQDSTAVFDTTAGPHKLKISAPGYRPTEEDALAIDGQVVSVPVTLEPLPATLVVSGAPGASIAVDGKVIGKTGGELALPAGRHRITVMRRGRYAWERDLDFERGGKLAVDAPLATTTQRRIAWSFLGGSAVLLGAAVTTGILAYSAQDDYFTLDDKANTVGISDAERVSLDDAIDRRDRFRTTTYVLASVGGAALLTGVVLYFIDTPRVEAGAPPPAAPAVTPVVGASTVGLSWQGTF